MRALALIATLMLIGCGPSETNPVFPKVHCIDDQIIVFIPDHNEKSGLKQVTPTVAFGNIFEAASGVPLVLVCKNENGRIVIEDRTVIPFMHSLLPEDNQKKETQ